MLYGNNVGRLGCWLHHYALRNSLPGSKNVVSNCWDDPVMRERDVHHVGGPYWMLTMSLQAQMQLAM
jgi:hypothetical protein